MHVDVSTDVCVVGGGMAGVCAALGAARHGAQTVLIQDRPVLGGNASSEIRMHICGAGHHRNVWRETGLIEELRLHSLFRNKAHNVSVQDLAFYDIVRRQKGLKLFLNARVEECRVEPKRVVCCTAHELTGERRITVVAKYFVDASGDGTLAFLAGAKYRHGREGRDEYEESLAPAEADNCTLGHTIMFQIVDTGGPVSFIPPPWALVFETDADLPHRSHTGPFGFWWIEWGGTLDTVSDTEKIKDELLAAALGIWDHMKNKGDHGFANYTLNWLGFLPAKRESRRFIGESILTQDDVMEGRQFADQIAYGGWPIDTHPPLGFRSPEPPCSQTSVNKPYGIPLRCCICRGFENLFVAGRNISATHVAFASTRVMATCAAIGEAVGTAASIAVQKRASAQDVASRHIVEVQQTLLGNGVYLLDVRNDDPADLARGAAVSASSAMPGDFAPAKVVDGCNHPEESNFHGWRSDSAQGLPAWLELRWSDPVEIESVQVILDTDFDSLLFLTQDMQYHPVVAPVPRATTIRDFELQVEHPLGNKRKVVASVAENYQRLVRVRFPVEKTSALRLVVKAAWGVQYASVFEIRCYGPKTGSGFACG